MFLPSTHCVACCWWAIGVAVRAEGGEVPVDDALEEQDRFAVFRRNLAFIDTLNSQNPHALCGITRFADRTEAERGRASQPMLVPPPASARPPNGQSQAHLSRNAAPTLGGRLHLAQGRPQTSSVAGRPFGVGFSRPSGAGGTVSALRLSCGVMGGAAGGERRGGWVD